MLDSIDHLVLTVSDPEASAGFYTDVLGLKRHTCGEGRVGVKLGNQKIKFHPVGKDLNPQARAPAPGSADVCFLSSVPLYIWQMRLEEQNVAVELGPVPRAGAQGPIESLYLRDPDGNLVEISVLADDPLVPRD